MTRRLLGMLLALAVLPAAAPRPACDSACLTGLATSYVAALADRGASAKLPWAPRVRYAENGVPMMVDDGIWATVTAAGAQPLIVADPATDGVIWMGMIAEHGQPSFLALRLKVAGRHIAEAEAVIRRKEGPPPFADPAAFAFAIAPGQRLPRARLETLARGWFEATPRLAAACTRTENGVAMPCARPKDGARIRGLAFPIVDEGRGIVIAMATEDHAARPATLTDPRAPRYPRSLATVTALRIADGAIAGITQVSTELPYRMPVWSDHE